MLDQEIIDLLFQRSDSAIIALQQKFDGLCRSVISRILLDKRDVEECISDTYLRVWNSIPPQCPDRLDSYLARIARNLALDRYDYNTASMRHTALTMAYEELALYLPSREQDTDGVEFRVFLNNFLRSQPKLSRMMFVRRYWYGESVSGLANTFGCSEEKVKSTLFRMRKKLRESMIKEDIYL